MKTKLACLILTAVHLHFAAAARADEDFVAHEWGTFTSVQGADGIQFEWNPLATTELPKFVYNTSTPLPDPRRHSTAFASKSAFRTLQRMETPVIYFYSAKERAVDVTVKFPQGLITEWYPQARDIGPSAVQPRSALVTLDNAADKTGLKLPFNFSSLDTRKGINDSLIRWTDVQVFPAQEPGELTASLPTDKSGSHYYAARDTDADVLRVSADPDKQAEHEKFLFYRGIGNFQTPLQVTLSGDEQSVNLRNNGKEDLANLFVLHVRKGAGKFIFVDRLAPGQTRSVQLDVDNDPLQLSDLVELIGSKVQKALSEEGLYRREAVAMVNTWRDSWFEEQGLRVLYTLPRAWTDRVLPLALEPKPREVVRVMVGRAEMITPSMEWELMKQVVRFADRDEGARARAIEDTRQLGLGRFMEPTTRRLTTKMPNREFSRIAWELLQAAAKPAAESKRLAAK
jgi:hypothetical protein